jgi:hypothetical protein
MGVVSAFLRRLSSTARLVDSDFLSPISWLLGSLECESSNLTIPVRSDRSFKG